MTIRVVLADDQALIRAGFRVIVESASDLEVVGEASTGREVVQLAQTTDPDVIVMDVRMPDINGIEATRQIAADSSLSRVKILVLTTFELDEYVVDAVRAGASGFLGKGVQPEDFLDAIRIVAGGEALLSPRATRALVANFMTMPTEGAPSDPLIDSLTPREREVVVLVAFGLSNDEIAQKLVVSPLTAKTHVNRAMSKVGARDRAQLVVLAYQSGLVNSG